MNLLNLISLKICSDEDEGSYTNEKLYSKYTLYFKIPKENKNKKLIYISIPDVYLTSEGYIEIIVNEKFPGWAIALIVIGSVWIIALIIILIICYFIFFNFIPFYYEK